MPRDLRLFLEDILEEIANIKSFIEHLDWAAFESNLQANRAVILSLYIIGEAVRNIPDELRDEYPHVEWRKINALRNIIAHIYFGIDLEQFWSIVQTDVPQLKIDVEQMLSDLNAKNQSDAP